MTFLESIPLIGPLLATLAPFILVLSVIVFVHEYGHYIVGRWCGVKSDAFSIGFGPEIVGWTDRRGTRWKLSWIPLGGYVKFRGDADAASAGAGDAMTEMTPEQRRETLLGAPIWARSLTVAAGPGANFIFAIIMLALMGLSYGLPTATVAEVREDSPIAAFGVQAGDEIVSVNDEPVETTFGVYALLMRSQGEESAIVVRRDGAERVLTGRYLVPATVGAVQFGRAAADACLQQGDEIVAVDGAAIMTFRDLQRAVEDSEGRTLAVDVDRSGETLSFALTPEIRQARAADGTPRQVYRIGIMHGHAFGLTPTMRTPGVFEAIALGATQTMALIERTLFAIGDLITGLGDLGDLSGPVGIAAATGDAAAAGLEQVLMLTALLSVAIGLFNLFPIPVLDGGHLLFYGIEAIRGKPLSERTQNAVALIGLTLILTLLAFVTYQDVMRVGSEIGCVAQ